MKYTLVLVTHGDAPTLEETLASFADHLCPWPASLHAFVDGPGRWPESEPFGQFSVHGSSRQHGFCATVRSGWQAAAMSEHDHVLWLENDFTLLRNVDLREIAAVLDSNTELSQMSLMRDAVNEAEKLAGGLFESRPGEYEHRTTVMDEGHTVEWMLQRSYVITTNPALMRRQFMADNPWPDYPSNCEGKFGFDVRARGFAAGVWGDGSPWCRHTGTRTGRGY